MYYSTTCSSPVGMLTLASDGNNPVSYTHLRRKPGFTEKSHIFQHFYTKMEYIYNSLSVESA